MDMMASLFILVFLYLMTASSSFDNTGTDNGVAPWMNASSGNHGNVRTSDEIDDDESRLGKQNDIPPLVVHVGHLFTANEDYSRLENDHRSGHQVVAEEPEQLMANGQLLLLANGDPLRAGDEHKLADDDQTDSDLPPGKVHSLEEDSLEDGKCEKNMTHFEVIGIDFDEVMVPISVAMWIAAAAVAKLGELNLNLVIIQI